MLYLSMVDVTCILISQGKNSSEWKQLLQEVVDYGLIISDAGFFSFFEKALSPRRIFPLLKFDFFFKPLIGNF